MKHFLVLTAISCAAVLNMRAQTVITTTISGSLKVNDSLQVINNINSAGDIRAAGEVVSIDTMRAKKDVLVDGNAVIDGNLNVGGTARVDTIRVRGPLIFNNAPPLALDPCIKLLVTQLTPGGDQVVALSPTQVANIEALIEGTPCPQPPVIPFTWQTYGNHVNSNSRWIGTYENYDFNIKTNNTYQLICKSNGDIGLGAFGGNIATTNGKKYRLFISNTGDISGGVQDAAGKYPFVVKSNGAVSIGIPPASIASYMLNVNGAVNIGTPFTTTSPYMLTVNGRIGAREIKVSIQNPWPDYVFTKEYKLSSLETIENYIVQNKHLPNVPAANDLSKEVCGLDIAKMQGIQMEKIEEIYLHLIELNNQIKELKKENALLKEQLAK